MNCLLDKREDIMNEIKEMVENIENIKANIDIFQEIVKKQISAENV